MKFFKNQIQYAAKRSLNEIVPVTPVQDPVQVVTVKERGVKKSILMSFVKALPWIILTVFLIVKVGAIRSLLGIEPKQVQRRKALTVPIYNDENLSAEIRESMNKANLAAMEYASAELDKWIDDVTARAEDDFINDYFGFIETKKREVQSFAYWVGHGVAPRFIPSAEEKIIGDLEYAITNKVIRPEVSQMVIQNVTKNAINVYMTTFDNELIRLQEEWDIPLPEWNAYISSITGIAYKSEEATYPLSLKVAVVSGTTLTGVMIAPLVKKIVAKVSSKIVAKIAAKSATSAGTAAAKTGAVAAGKGAAGFGRFIPVIGWGITIGVAVWDVIDYWKSSAEGKENFRDGLRDYLYGVKTELLGNTEDSVMGSILIWENKLKANIEEQQKGTVA